MGQYLNHSLISPYMLNEIGWYVSSLSFRKVKTQGLRVRASPVSLHCGPCARHIYPNLVLVQPRKTRPCLTDRLLIGRNQIKSNKHLEESISNFRDASMFSIAFHFELKFLYKTFFMLNSGEHSFYPAHKC